LHVAAFFSVAMQQRLERSIERAFQRPRIGSCCLETGSIATNFSHHRTNTGFSSRCHTHTDILPATLYYSGRPKEDGLPKHRRSPKINYRG